MSDTISKYWEMVEDGTMPPPAELKKIAAKEALEKAYRNIRIKDPNEIRKLATEMANESDKHSNNYDLVDAFEKMLITFLK
jgi:hypothetical protein